MSNELKKHKKSDKVKWFVTLLAILLIAVAVTATITKGFRNWNPFGWFDKKEETAVIQTNNSAVKQMSLTTEGETSENYFYENSNVRFRYNTDGLIEMSFPSTSKLFDCSKCANGTSKGVSLGFTTFVPDIDLTADYESVTTFWTYLAIRFDEQLSKSENLATMKIILSSTFFNNFSGENLYIYTGGYSRGTFAYEGHDFIQLAHVKVYKKTYFDMPTKDGYKFEGWYVDKAMTMPYNFGDYHFGELYEKFTPVEIVVKPEKESAKPNIFMLIISAAIILALILAFVSLFKKRNITRE